eukprot:8107227-Pyramimonas_sp.AAC.1
MIQMCNMHSVRCECFRAFRLSSLPLSNKRSANHVSRPRLYMSERTCEDDKEYAPRQCCNNPAKDTLCSRILC